MMNPWLKMSHEGAARTTVLHNVASYGQPLDKKLYIVFTARCYACAVLAMGLCLSVSVCHKSEFY